MPCTEVKSSTYQTRKSPAFHAGDCKGLEKKGKDGTYVSQADKRGIYKWVKKGTQKRKGKFYDVVDNGRRPYRVYIDGSTVSIYKGPTYDILIKKISVKKVYLGKGKSSAVGNSIWNPMTSEKQSVDIMKGKKMKGFHMISK